MSRMQHDRINGRVLRWVGNEDEINEHALVGERFDLAIQ